MTPEELQIGNEYYCIPLQQDVILIANPPNLPSVVVETEEGNEYVVLRDTLEIPS